jgi:two-component sensor histidine kinase
MSSLISLETDYVTDPQARRLFAETQSRVRSMALIHEELYQSKDLARVNFADYLHRLTTGLMQIYAAHPNIDLHLDIAEVFLGVDTAIPCGLIINELMTNALKYAFPNGRPGVITVMLETGSNSRGETDYILTLQDNGVGLPPNFNFNNTTTLGLQLVSILIAQLKGEIKINSHNGTQFTLLFSEANPEKLPAVKQR